MKIKFFDFLKHYGALLFVIISTLYFEIIFHVFAFNDFKVLNLFIFTLPIALLIYLLSTIGNKTINKIVTFLFTILLTILFLSQFIYFDLFDAIYGTSSFGYMNQVITAFEKVVSSILYNWLYCLLTFIPLIVLIIINKKINFEFNKKKNTLLSLIFTIVFYIISLLYMQINKDNIYSNYNLYYKVNQPILSTNKLGLTTYFGLELYRTTFGYPEETLLMTLAEPTPEPDPEYDYNIIDIDFDKLNSETTDKDLITLNNFFKNKSATQKNEYTGLFEGKNLIVVLAESLDKSIITEEFTPTLYKMKEEGIHFNNYYTPLFPGSTGSGEYMTEWSLLSTNVAKSDELISSIGNNNPYRLNNSLKTLGYKTFAYHDYYSYFYQRNKYFKNDGYDKYGFCGTGVVKSCDNFRGSDLEMVKNTVKDYINEDNFYAYYITVSGHGNYNYYDNPIAQKYWSSVKGTSYSNTLKTYIAANMDLDKALEYLIKQLEEAGKLEDTVIVVTPDHYPYYFKNNELNEIDTEDRTDKFLMHHENLIIYTPGLENIEVDKYISNIDILPTILNLFGIEYDSRLLIGQDALSKGDGLVMLSDQSWINKYGYYDSIKNEFTQTTSSDKVIDENYINNTSQLVNSYFNLSNLIRSKKYYTYLFNNINN
ncbi:MAG: sulfatase-like hydrolase/transferase [Clostridium sp.]|nr:sulfatase-like hydrolase/transferase [Clostridium sp.]MCM1443970.1 sulfatase-like hydrolase/transferase [Candidatus Amulumruptor caecigallinarius]